MKKLQLTTLLWLVSSISGQTQVDVRTQTKNVDFSGAASTIPAKSGAALPVSCKLGEMFFSTTNSPGQNLYLCAPANTWTMVAGGGSGTGTGSGITVPAVTTVGNVPQYSNTTGSALSGGLAVVTSLGTPGSNSNIPTEQSVRSAISAATNALPNLTGSTVLQASQHIAEGDSITYGYLVAADTCNGAVGGCKYPSLLAYDENATLTDRASNGEMACDMAQSQTIKSDLSTIDKNPAIYTMLIGANDANTKGTGAYEAIYQGCHKAAIAWDAVANKVAANSTNCTDTGTWVAFTGYSVNPGESSTTNGSTKSCTITTFGGPLYAWYFQNDGNGGTFTYAVDGGGATALTTATSPVIATQNGSGGGWGLIRVTGLAAGSHTIKFTVTSATNAANGVAISAIGTPAPQPTYGSPKVFVGGIPRQQGDANSAATAQYNADTLADVNLLAGDGLGVYFVNVRNYLCASVAGGLCYNSFGVADMQPLGTTGDGGLHPNDVGHNDLKQAFEDAEQFIPYVSTASSAGTGTINSGAAGQFAYYTAAGTAVSGHTLAASDVPALNYDASGAAAAAQTASLQKSNNLSDLASSATARTNLGLGTAATQASSAFQSALTFTGTGSRTVSGTGAGVSGNCAKWDASGNVVDAGAPCGSGSGGGSSAWASLTPGTNTAGAFIVGSGASLAASGTGSITATSVPASGVGGTLAAVNLPNPTASTLGGVESLAATSHQWINSISTAGIPTLSQPAFADVSGVATDLQLPTDQCILTKYPVAYSALTGAASATPTYPLMTLAGTSTRICLIEISGATSFAGTSITAATVRLQSGAGTPLLYSPNQDIFGTVGATTNNYWTDAGSTADRTNQGVVAAFTFTGGLSSALTAGSVNITIGTRTMP